MSKYGLLLRFVVSLVTCLAATVAFAQDYPWQSAAPSSTSTTQNKKNAPKALSQDEFKAQVNAIIQQKQQATATQQINQILGIHPVVIPNAPPTPAPTQTTSKSTTTTTTTPENTEQTETTTTESTTKETPTTAPALPPPPQAVAPGPMQQEKQTQVYTGFGGGSNTGSAPAKQSSGGGWNIKY